MLRTLFSILILATFSLVGCGQNIPNAQTAEVKIYGNCGMCERKIEKAALKKGEAFADWDTETKMAKIIWDSTKTTLNEILKRIADSGYDSDLFRASDEVYKNLHHCCKYDRPASVSGSDD